MVFFCGMSLLMTSANLRLFELILSRCDKKLHTSLKIREGLPRSLAGSGGCVVAIVVVLVVLVVVVVVLIAVVVVLIVVVVVVVVLMVVVVVVVVVLVDVALFSKVLLKISGGVSHKDREIHSVSCLRVY